MKKMLKKVISMLIVICLMIGIANIPVYAKVNSISATKTTTDAVLSKTYVTPSQAAKKATATTKPASTKKTTAKKATSTKKPAAKAVSLTSKIIKKYTKKGLIALKALANKLGLKLKTVYNSFVKMGVTKAQIKKVSSLVLKLIKKGENFVNCAALAVSKYLNISKQLAAVKNLAADISIDANRFVSSHKNGFIGTYKDAQVKTLQKSGVKKAEEIQVKLSDLMNLKKGQKALVSIDCYKRNGQNSGGHAITIEREKNGKYAVYDILINGGNKIIYTAKEFKKFLNGKSAKGKTAYGKSITKPTYLSSEDGAIRYNFISNGKISIRTDSSKFIDSNLKSLANKNYSLINKLLKKSGLSSVAKTWLTKAKALVKSTLNGSKKYSEKESLLGIAYSLLGQVSKAGVSVMSLAAGTTSIFSSLKSLLKNNFTYKVYNKYGEDGVNVVSAISKKYNLNKNTVYNTFVNNKITKENMRYIAYSVLDDIKNGKDIFRWRYADENINKAMAAIKILTI